MNVAALFLGIIWTLFGLVIANTGSADVDHNTWAIICFIMLSTGAICLAIAGIRRNA